MSAITQKSRKEAGLEDPDTDNEKGLGTGRGEREMRSSSQWYDYVTCKCTWFNLGNNPRKHDSWNYQKPTEETW